MYSFRRHGFLPSFLKKVFDDVRAIERWRTRRFLVLPTARKSSAVVDYLQKIGESLGLEIET